jgi:hypothetical protein
MKKILLALGSITCLAFLFLWNDGKFRTFARALNSGDYPVLTESLDKPSVTFDLRDLEPSILGLGLVLPKEEKNRKEKILENLKIDGIENLKIERTYLDYNGTGNEVTVFYVFELSRHLGSNPIKELIVSVGHQTPRAELILFDYGIK